MPISVQGFLSFGARYAGLLTELARQRAPVSDEELRSLIEQHGGHEDVSVQYVIGQLIALGIVEPDPAETAFYELARPVLDLMDWLLLRQRLTSAAVITGYLDDLEALATELDGMLRNWEPQKTIRILSDVDTVLERMRQDSRANREAIISEALFQKSTGGKAPSRERFDRVNRLWEKYLIPLRQLIDVDHVVDARLNRLELTLVSVQNLDAALAMLHELVRTRARLTRLRRQFLEDHAEGMREIQPLYEQIRRDTELVRAASRALERVRAEGLRPLRLDERLALPVWRTEGLMSNAALETFMIGLKGYQPQRPPALPMTDHSINLPALITREAVATRLVGQLPVGDVLAWLTNQFPEAPVVEILRAYSWIHRGDFGHPMSRPDTDEQCYRHKDVTLLAWPIGLSDRGVEAV